MPTSFLPTTTSSTNATASQTITIGIAGTGTPIYYISDGQMFVPLGSGWLYYHSIPTTALTTSWASSTNSPAYWQARPYVPPSLAFPPRPLARPALLAGRRALRRSIELFRRLRPEDEIRTFLSGKPLTVRGHRFDYRVQKRADVLRHTMNPHDPHIPYRLSLHSKDGKVIASSGCLVIPDTPVIDQLLALILHVQDPEEEMVVLRRTNWNANISRQLAA